MRTLRGGRERGREREWGEGGREGGRKGGREGRRNGEIDDRVLMDADDRSGVKRDGSRERAKKNKR